MIKKFVKSPKKLSQKQIHDLYLHISSKTEVKAQEFINQLNIKYGQPQQKEGHDEEAFKRDYAVWKLSNEYKKARFEEAQWDKKNSKPIEGWREELKILNSVATLRKI